MQLKQNSKKSMFVIFYKNNNLLFYATIERRIRNVGYFIRLMSYWAVERNSRRQDVIFGFKIKNM